MHAEGEHHLQHLLMFVKTILNLRKLITSLPDVQGGCAPEAAASRLQVNADVDVLFCYYVRKYG